MTRSISIPNEPGLPTPTGDWQRQVRPATAGPLSSEDRVQIARAQERRKKITRATKIASFNAWSFAVFAGFSLLFALFSLSSLIAAAVLGGLAWNEFRGRRQLQQLHPLGPKTLGINQLVCCTAIALYCGLKLYAAMTGPGPYAQSIEQSPEIAEMLEPMQQLLKTATISTYLLILIVGVAVQGATAWYYFSRKRWLDDYLQETPGWVVDMHRAS